MTLHVHLETDPAKKRALHTRLTALLPDWFGMSASNAQYANQAERLDGIVAAQDGEPCGLLLLKWASPISAEVYWMGVDPKAHRAGIGRALIEAAAAAVTARGIKYLFVSTLHPDDPFEPYQRTRRFYEAVGFAYVLEEQFPADPDNRAATYLKVV